MRLLKLHFQNFSDACLGFEHSAARGTQEVLESAVDLPVNSFENRHRTPQTCKLETTQTIASAIS